MSQTYRYPYDSLLTSELLLL